MLADKKISLLKKQVAQNSSIVDQAELFKCIGDPTCLRILSVFESEKELCVTDVTEVLGISMPAVSHQLSKLKRLGVLKTLRMGQMICYSFSDTKNASFVRRVLKMPH